MIRRAIPVLLAGLLASGCASGFMAAEDSDSGEMAEIKERILELQQSAAMARVEIDRLRQQVATLEARLEGGGEPPRASLAAPPAADPAPDRPLRPAPPVVEVSDLEPDPVSAPPSAPPPPVPAPAPSSPAPVQPVSEAAQALYDRGYTLYHQGRYVDAEAGFRRFLQAHPETSLSDNAQYWIGECRFARGDYEAALAAFQEAVERYPGGNKVADSLLKAADCSRRLGDAETARAGYDEVMRRFPGSAAAAAAAERRVGL